MSEFIWYERYRPQTLAEMTMTPANMKAFRRFVALKEMPHLLLSGGPGSGKSTLAQILIKELNAVSLDLNASSKDRGIETIRTKVTQFARSKQGDGRLKIVWLDEADAMTPDALNALKNTMEKYSKHCRFILTANHLEKIIDPIKSRCQCFTFNQFSKKRLMQLIGGILKAESYKAPQAGVVKLVDAYYPDIRTILNELQNCCAGPKFALKNAKALSIDTGVFFKYLRAGKIKDIRNILADITDYIPSYKLLFNEFIPTLKTDELKGEAALIIAEYMNNDPMTPIKDINFTACLVELCNVLKIQPRF